MSTARTPILWAALVALVAVSVSAQPVARDDWPSAEELGRLAARVDPFVERPRVLVLTDIANEPDDQMSLVRYLVYSNEYDTEGLVATTSTWMRRRVRPDVIHLVLDAYASVHANLSRHAEGFPTAESLRALVRTGPEGYGMEAVGGGGISSGAALILEAADRDDERPLWVLAWGGANTLAEALLHARGTRTPEGVEALVAKLRVYTISDQDDAGSWLRREFPTLHYVAMPSTQNGEEYYLATWTGISGDLFYRNCDGADFTTFRSGWIDANIRSRGPLGELYIPPCCIHEGDTPSFLGLIGNGLASFMSPSYGGWGGRYVWRQPSGEARPFWTQGGDSYPGNPSSRDTVVGVDGDPHTSDTATIWRWREDFQRDFAARMAWTVESARDANHNPEVVVNGESGEAPITLQVALGEPVVLDATGTADPDGDGLRYAWFFYSEAGSGVPGRPVFVRRRPPGGGVAGEGGIGSTGPDGPPRLPPRVTIEDADAPVARATLVAPRIGHVILAVRDDGTPSLTSYRRIILESRD